jgi:hypothetical protein
MQLFSVRTHETRGGRWCVNTSALQLALRYPTYASHLRRYPEHSVAKTVGLRFSYETLARSPPSVIPNVGLELSRAEV